MNGTPQMHSPNIDTDDFVHLSIIHDPEAGPVTEVVRYDQLVRQLFKPDTEKVMALHWCSSIVGEFGEIAELLEQSNLHSNVRILNLIEELGDVEFYYQAARSHYGFSYKYISQCLDPLKDFYAGDYLLDSGILYALGLLSDAVKREYIYNKPRDPMQVTLALSAIHNCLEAHYRFLAQHYIHKLQSLRADVLQANADKLAKRYVNLKYSDAAAIARADKASPAA